MAKEVWLELSCDQALVLFDWLARTGSADRPARFEDQSERRVLWDIEADLEGILGEVLHEDYRLKLAAARDNVRDAECT